MKAPAVVFPEPGRVEIWDMEVAEPGPDDVRVRTAFSGISQGTERWALTGRYGHFDEDYPAYYPCSPGYQAAGVVEAVGSAASERRLAAVDGMACTISKRARFNESDNDVTPGEPPGRTWLREWRFCYCCWSRCDACCSPPSFYSHSSETLSLGTQVFWVASDYSWRSACMGSMQEARRAGP